MKLTSLELSPRTVGQAPVPVSYSSFLVCIDAKAVQLAGQRPANRCGTNALHFHMSDSCDRTSERSADAVAMSAAIAFVQWCCRPHVLAATFDKIA